MGGSSKAPDIPDLVPVEIPAPTPVSVDDGVKRAADDERRQRLAASGHSSTVLTGATGLNTIASTGKKNLLGG